VTRLLQRLTILATLVVVACGPPPAASVSSTMAPSAPTSPSPSTPTFGPCQLPVRLSGGPPSQDGWLALPGGQFSPDPSANGVRSSYGNVAWDSGIGKWLPTRQSMISPDGSAYIPDAPYLNEIVDANTGTISHEIAPGPGYFWVAGWTSAGIYLLGGSGKSPVPGLWHVDPTTGAVTEVPGSANLRAGWSLVDESAAWASVIKSDNSASLLRLDLSTGDVRTVYTTSSNQWAALLGFADSGVLALVNAQYIISALVIGADGTVATVPLPAGLVGTSTSVLSPGIQDGTSILFSGTQGVFAYDPIHGVQVLVADGRDFDLLGRCKS
jgi:hypothetical protein